MSSSEVSIQATGRRVGIGAIITLIVFAASLAGGLLGAAAKVGADQNRLSVVEKQLTETAAQLKRDLDREEAVRRQADVEFAQALKDVRAQVEKSTESTNAKIDQVLFLLTGRAKP